MFKMFNSSNSIKEKEDFFNKFYGKIDGYEVSWKAKNDYHDQDALKDILYGETPFNTFYKILNSDIIKDYIKNAEVYYDLGSGTGRTVIASYLIKKFRKSVGIELLDGLYDKSQEILKEIAKEDPEIKKHVSFIKGSFLEEDFDDADIISIDYPSPNNDIRNALYDRVTKKVKKGTIVLSVIGLINNPYYRELGSERFEFSWGGATIYYYVIDDPKI